MSDVRDFMFAMVPTTKGDIKLNIRFFEKDHMDEFTVGTVLSWFDDVKRGFDQLITGEELVRKFENGRWYRATERARRNWNEKRYSVDEDSLYQAGLQLKQALMALVEGARPMEKDLMGWDDITV